jgi:hypothetical protein
MTRTASTTAVILVAALLVPGLGNAGMDGDTVVARAGNVVSATATPRPGHSDVMYRVPSTGMLVTRACVEHTAMTVEIGREERRLSYGARGCTYYDPGFVVAGGETIYCDNGSGLARTCALVGVLEGAAERKGHRVRFYDLN